MCWKKKVRGTAQSGIWVQKGDVRNRMLPATLDHLRVRWISRGTYETAWVTPGHDCLCSGSFVCGQTHALTSVSITTTIIQSGEAPFSSYPAQSRQDTTSPSSTDDGGNIFCQTPMQRLEVAKI